MRLHLACGLLLTVLIPGFGLAKGKVQIFTYISSSGDPRVCKGDTTTGEAICAESALGQAKVRDLSKPEIKDETAEPIRYFRYQSPFPKPGPDGYQFFVYYNSSGDVRICVGNTANGEAVCRDSSSHRAKAKAGDKLTFSSETDPVKWFKYFPWSEKDKPGSFSFSAYTKKDGSVRVCRAQTETGLTLCADGASLLATTAGDVEPDYKPTGEGTFYLKY
jgi:hypothetical protein